MDQVAREMLREMPARPIDHARVPPSGPNLNSHVQRNIEIIFAAIIQARNYRWNANIAGCCKQATAVLDMRAAPPPEILALLTIPKCSVLSSANRNVCPPSAVVTEGLSTQCCQHRLTVAHRAFCLRQGGRALSWPKENWMPQFTGREKLRRIRHAEYVEVISKDTGDKVFECPHCAADFNAFDDTAQLTLNQCVAHARTCSKADRPAPGK
jgi:hypothetical protein